MTDEPPPEGRRKVRRGEGEVTEWPRGLVDYTPAGAPDSAPSPDEDRDRNRLRLASRLLGMARAQGHAVDEAVRRLYDADRAFQDGDRARGRRLVEDVISEAEAWMGGGASARKPSP